MSSLKAQSTTPSSTTTSLETAVSATSNGVPLKGSGGNSGFLSAVSARKEREKGAQVISNLKCVNLMMKTIA